MAGRGRGGRNVQYTAQDEPAFIKRFKEKAGYKEDPGIEAKRHNPECDWSDEDSLDAQLDDEKPLVVVLKPGDLTAEEAEAQAIIDGHQNSSTEGQNIGRIVFRKPAKREMNDSDNQGLNVATPGGKKSRRADSNEQIDSKANKKSSQSKDESSKSAKKQLNSHLLSFDDDDADA